MRRKKGTKIYQPSVKIRTNSMVLKPREAAATLCGMVPTLAPAARGVGMGAHRSGHQWSLRLLASGWGPTDRATI